MRTAIPVKSAVDKIPSMRCTLLLLIVGCALNLGCGTKTHRIATEQMLLSDAVDRAVGGIDFGPIAGRKVYLDTKYIESARVQHIINAEYVVSSLRHQLTIANCTLQTERDKADLILEARIGTLGTDGHETVYGIPSSDVSRAAPVLTGSLLPLALLPELSVGRNNAQSAFAKLIVFAYDRETSEPVWQSGIAKAESNSKDTWIFGAGPFQKGSIHDGVRFEGREIESLPIADFRKHEDKKSKPYTFENAVTFSSLPKLEPDAAAKTATPSEAADPDKDAVIQAAHEGEQDK